MTSGPDTSGLPVALAGGAQALGLDGKLIDDFQIQRYERVVNVCNAPSPAATACLNIGRIVAEQVLSGTTGTV